MLNGFKNTQAQTSAAAISAASVDPTFAKGSSSPFFDDDKADIEKNARRIVFLVDDDEADLTLAHIVLKGSHKITEIVCTPNAETLKEELLKRGYYHQNGDELPNALILLDIHMPKTSGMNLLTELRTHPQTQNIPVIMLSGDFQTDNIEKSYHLKANGFLTKPLNADHLDHIHNLMQSSSN